VFLISDTNLGGSAVSTSLLVKRINRERFHIIVVACGSGPGAALIGKLADEYHNLNVGSFPQVRKMQNGKYREDSHSWICLFVWILKCIWRFTFWLFKNKVDLIHTNTIHYNVIAGISGRLAGVPSIWHIRGPQLRPWRHGGPLLVEGYVAALLATKFIANSRFTTNTFHRSWKNKTVVIWNAIDAKSIAANQHTGRLRKMANVSDAEMLVGVAGVIAPRKGMERFVEMACKLSRDRDNVKFAIVGGPLSGQEKSIVSDLMKLAEIGGISDKLYFTGQLDNASFYMGDMDAFFMCSRPFTESFGLVVVEAMAANVPVVAFSNDAMPEIIEDGETGFLVPEGDTTLAKERILQILDDAELSSRFKRAAKKRVFDNFDTAILINNIEKLYMEILQ